MNKRFNKTCDRLGRVLKQLGDELSAIADEEGVLKSRNSMGNNISSVMTIVFAYLNQLPNNCPEEMIELSMLATLELFKKKRNEF